MTGPWVVAISCQNNLSFIPVLNDEMTFFFLCIFTFFLRSHILVSSMNLLWSLAQLYALRAIVCVK